ncbi:MFS transporter [Thozetella sp. PMI_491]|nr:MFS transporter [Thozetella sp. PMI_491]
MENSTHFQTEKDSHVEEHESPKKVANELAASEESPLDKKIVLKLDCLVIPLVTVVYLLAFLDRANVGNARVAGFQADLKLTDLQYQTAITITYVPYILTEIPSNLIIKKIGPRIYIPVLCFSWGIISTLQCLVQNYAGVLACRFFLGMMEGGLFPGIILYLSEFYRRQELSLRIALFWSASSLSGAFSGLLAAAISNMNGVAGLAGWRWIFLLEGVFTACWAVFTYFSLPNSPQTVKFFSAEESARCMERLRLDVDALEDEKFKLGRVFSVFRDPHLILVWLCSFCSGSAIFGLAYFSPSIVRDMGFSPIQTQLMSVPPYAWAFVLSTVTSYYSDKFMMRGVPMLITYFISLAGSIMFLVGRSIGVRYTGLFLLLGGVYANAPALIAWVPNNCATHTRRATSVAMTCIAVNLGGIISTWIFPQSDAPYYPFAAKFLLAMNVIAIVLTGLAMWVCDRANKRKQDPEYRQKLLRDLGDLSLAQQLEQLGDHHPDFKSYRP